MERRAATLSPQRLLPRPPPPWQGRVEEGPRGPHSTRGGAVERGGAIEGLLGSFSQTDRKELGVGRWLFLDREGSADTVLGSRTSRRNDALGQGNVATPRECDSTAEEPGGGRPD